MTSSTPSGARPALDVLQMRQILEEAEHQLDALGTDLDLATAAELRERIQRARGLLALLRPSRARERQAPNPPFWRELLPERKAPDN